MAAKLTHIEVWAIRREYAKGKVTYAQLAAKYGVTFQAIGHIVTRRKWKHI